MASVLVTVPCWALSYTPPKYFSLVITSTSYSDLKSNQRASGVQESTLNEALGAEFGVRVHTVFQVVAMTNRCLDGSCYGYGGGFRIDIPGFFWIGGPDQIVRTRRFYPINISMHGLIIQSTLKNENGSKETAIGSDLGFALDLFLFNPSVFLAGRASIQSHLGNSYLATSVGLGLEF